MYGQSYGHYFASGRQRLIIVEDIIYLNIYLIAVAYVVPHRTVKNAFLNEKIILLSILIN